MFTIKYIYPDGQENITTDWEFVSAEYVDEEGNAFNYKTAPQQAEQNNGSWPAYQVVHAHNERQDRRMTFGPNLPPREELAGDTVRRIAHVYVMNETGATVAKYTL